MVTEENLGRKIDQADKESQYDSCAKRLLGEKIVLAFILKYTVPEFAPYPIEDIRDRYIEGVDIARRGVDVDESNVEITSANGGSAIRGENVESVTRTEGKVTYDIIFTAIVPSTGTPIHLIINVEAQKSDSEEYEIITRGFYYCGRMISAQKGTVFNRSEYQKLRKVYSIWVCMNPKSERRNTMNMYSTEEHNIFGSYKAEKKSYDLMSVVTLNLDTQKESEQPILKFLEVLLSDKKDPEEKKKALLDDYGIATTSQMDKEMSDMCNLSRGIAEENRAKGMAEGMAKGVTMGEDKLSRLINLLLMNNEMDKITVATSNSAEREKMYKEYGIA